MNMHQSINEALRTNVTQVNNRVYPLVMPQDTKHSAITYFFLSDSHNSGYCGTTQYQNYHIQVDVFSESMMDALSIKDKVIQVLQEHFNVSNLQVFEMYEEITLKYRQVIDFTIMAEPP